VCQWAGNSDVHIWVVAQVGCCVYAETVMFNQGDLGRTGVWGEGSSVSVRYDEGHPNEHVLRVHWRTTPPSVGVSLDGVCRVGTC
jgi:hypothetical protein